MMSDNTNDGPMETSPYYFDSDEVPIEEKLQPLPPAQYEVVIESAEEDVVTKAGGSYLKLVLAVISGEHKGRRIVEIINRRHSNPTVESIAKKRLATICRAVGKPRIRGGNDLLNIPFLVITKNESWGEGNLSPRIVIIEEIQKAKLHKDDSPWGGD